MNRVLRMHFAQWAAWLCLFLGCYSPAQAHPSALAAIQDQDARPLEPDQPIERELAGGQSHAYRLTLGAGQYLEVAVEQRGIDVLVKLTGADGKLLAQFESDSRSQGRETVARVVDAAGEYRLLVEARQRGAPAGRYAIRLVAVRAASAQDRALQTARQQSVEALRLVAAGKFDEALQLAERVVETREQALGPEHPEVATALYRLANIYRGNKGDFARAEPLYQRALKLAEQTPAPGHPELGLINFELGVIHFRNDDLVRAETQYLRALEIWQQTLGPNHANVEVANNALAALYGRKGDYARARSMFQRVLESREGTQGPEHASLVSPLIGLGNTHYQEGKYEQAEPHYQRAVRIADQTPAQTNPQLATALSNLAAILTSKGALAQGEALYRRALALLEKTLGPEHPETLNTLNNLASLHADQGAYAEAGQLHQSLLARREQALGPEHSAVALTHLSLARDALAQGALPQALAAQTRATAISERNLAHNLAAGSEREKLLYLATYAEETDRTISLHIRSAPDDVAARQLALTTLLRRKGRALDAMTDSLATLRRRATPADQALLDQLQQTRATLAGLALRGPQGTPPAEYQRRLKALEAEREKLEGEISRRSAEFRAQTQPVTLAAVQAALPRHAALLEFAAYRPFNARFTKADEMYGAPRYVAYVLGRTGAPRAVDLGAQQPLDEAIARLREALRDKKRADVKQLARAVDRLAMQPLRRLLGQARRLLVSPDGALNLIPFAALVDPRGHYLVSHYTFSYLTSGRELLRLQVKQPSRQAALIVANPDFGGDDAPAAAQRLLKLRPAQQAPDSSGPVLAEAYFPALPGTAGEARALKTLLPEAEVYTNQQASEAAVKRARGPRILHIATHGFFFDEPQGTTGGNRLSPAAQVSNARIANPLLRSGLALAGANQLKGVSTAGLTAGPNAGDDDGILTALEAAGLDLCGTQLVVLSACDTGVGEVRNGEGVYGLRRALVLAGAEAQVMSLWPVSDLATGQLMIEYYRHLQQGAGRADALRQVQLRILGSQRLKSTVAPRKPRDYSHPYYWASFIHSGEWAKLASLR